MSARWWATTVVLAACGSDDLVGGPSLKATIGLDVSNIAGFALSDGPPQGAMARREEGTHADAISQLYAIDAQGNLVITSLMTRPDGTDETTTASVVPLSIVDTPSYTVFGFDGLRVEPNKVNDQGVGAVIMRKSDGALFGYEGGRAGKVQSNGGDLLFLDGAPIVGGEEGLQRVDMATTPPESVTVSDEDTDKFDVSLDGDVMVSLDMTNGSTSNAVRIFKQNGGLQNLVATRAEGQWLDPAGHAFYYLYVDPVNTSTPAAFTISKATRQQDGTYTISAEGKVNQANTVNPQPVTRVTVLLTGPSTAYLWRSSTEPTIVDLLGPDQNTDHLPKALTGFATITDVRAAPGVLFVQGTDAAGNGGITRLDVPAFTATAIVPPGQFSLTAISASKTGDLAFAGLRNSDGKRVLGTVAAGASTYSISSESAPNVTYLQRIN